MTSLTIRQGPFSQPDAHFQSGPVPQYQQRNGRQAFMSSSQPTNMGRTELSETDHSQLVDEPSMSQFTANPHLPESLVSPYLVVTDLDSTSIPFQGFMSSGTFNAIPFLPS
jgi:hypothetical protein